MTQMNGRKYQLGISFATPQQKYAAKLYTALKNCRISRVFIYTQERERMAGEWQPQEYEHIFMHEVDRPIIILSKEYMDKTRRYTRIESQAALFGMHDRIAEGITPPLFLIKFDDVDLPGYNPGYNYFNPHEETLEQIAAIIAKKVKKK